MDFDRITENAEIYDPDGQVVRSTQTVEEQASNQDGAPAGITVGNNLPDALPDLDTGSGSQSQTSRIEETVNYEITKTVKTHIHEAGRSEEHTSELQSLMRISYAVFCLKKKKRQKQKQNE